MDRGNPTYSAELEARRRRRIEQRRARVRRVRAIAAFLAIIGVIGAVVAIWSLGRAAGPGHPVAEQVEFSAPTDLITPAIVYLKEYADRLPPDPKAPMDPAPGVKAIVVDRGSQTVTLYQANGTPAGQFRCATGVNSPQLGTYTITGRKDKTSYKNENLTLAYFVQFTKTDAGDNIGFHAIPRDKTGTQVGSLEESDPHGNVRIEFDKAKLLFTWAPNGTKVIVQR